MNYVPDPPELDQIEIGLAPDGIVVVFLGYESSLRRWQIIDRLPMLPDTSDDHLQELAHGLLRNTGPYTLQCVMMFDGDSGEVMELPEGLRQVIHELLNATTDAVKAERYKRAGLN